MVLSITDGGVIAIAFFASSSSAAIAGFSAASPLRTRARTVER
jgi:hypothetical protein